MTLENFLIVVVLVSLVAAYIILLAMKLGIIEWLQIHGDKYISEMAKCHFCMSFWTGTLLFVGVACWYDNPLFLMGGVVSCPLTRLML